MPEVGQQPRLHPVRGRPVDHRPAHVQPERGHAGTRRPARSKPLVSMLTPAATSKITVFGGCTRRCSQTGPGGRRRQTVGGCSYPGSVAFATEIPGSAAQPDVPVAHSEFRPVGDIPRTGGRFEVVSEYQPAGDQPAAIEELERRLRAGEQDVVLLGATGTGKSATTAWLIERLQRPTLVMAPNKTLAAQLANELREMLPNNAVEYFVSYYDYYQPEAYIAQTDTYIEKDSSINEDVERLRHSATMNLLSRRDVVVVASVSCIYGLGTPQSYLDRSVKLKVGGSGGARHAAAGPGRRAVHAQRHGVQPGHVPGPRRHRGDHPGVRGAGDPHRVLRRRGRGALLPPPAHRRRGPPGRRAADLPGHALRRRAGAHGAGGARHRGGAGGAAGRAGAPGQAAGGAAAADAHRLRHGDDPPGRVLLRHRELLAAHRRARPGHRPGHPDRLLPRRLPARDRRVARDGAADRRHVRGRHVPQAQPGRLRVPAPVGGRQPAADLGGVRRPDRADGLPLGHPGPVRAAPAPAASSSSR